MTLCSCSHVCLFRRLLFGFTVYISYRRVYLHYEFDISVTYELCLYKFMFLFSTRLWPFRTKYLVENYVINCVLVAFIVILIVKKYNGDELP